MICIFGYPKTEFQFFRQNSRTLFTEIKYSKYTVKCPVFQYFLENVLDFSQKFYNIKNEKNSKLPKIVKIGGNLDLVGNCPCHFRYATPFCSFKHNDRFTGTKSGNQFQLLTIFSHDTYDFNE